MLPLTSRRSRTRLMSKLGVARVGDAKRDILEVAEQGEVTFG